MKIKIKNVSGKEIYITWGRGGGEKDKMKIIHLKRSWNTASSKTRGSQRCSMEDERADKQIMTLFQWIMNMVLCSRWREWFSRCRFYLFIYSKKYTVKTNFQNTKIGTDNTKLNSTCFLTSKCLHFNREDKSGNHWLGNCVRSAIVEVGTGCFLEREQLIECMGRREGRNSSWGKLSSWRWISRVSSLKVGN